MADWENLKGKPYNISVGKTSAEALDSSTDSSEICFTKDGNIVFNGVKFVPTPQQGVGGTSSNYVYSIQSTTDKAHNVLSGNFKVYQYNGKIRVCHKLWGSTNDYSDGQYYSSDFPVVNSSSDGAMDHYVHARVLNHTLTEGNSTTNSVLVNYTNFANSGNKTLTLTAATSAKAGVMTVEQVKKLGDLNNRVINLESTEAGKRLHKIESHYKDLGHFDTETDALNKITELSVCADENLLHAHLTYTLDDGSKSSLILVQEIEGKWTRQIIVNHTKVFQRTIYFKTTERTELDWKENWSFLFCDRLAWNNTERKYIPSQFGEQFNSEYTDQIPLATSSVDGLMSKEDKAFLDSLKAKTQSEE